MLNPIFTSYENSDLFGKMIFLLLFIASITSWSLFIKKFLIIKEIRKGARSLQQTCKKNKINPLQIEQKNIKNSFYSICQALQTSALRRLKKNRVDEGPSLLGSNELEQIEEEVLLRAEEEIKKIEKNIYILSTTVSLAPFLGLLGTVWGILTTFLELQANSGMRAESMMMGGLGMALSTTVVGLVVAIPALLGYNYLRAQLALLRHEMSQFGHSLVITLGHYYCRVERSTTFP